MQWCWIAAYCWLGMGVTYEIVYAWCGCICG